MVVAIGTLEPRRMLNGNLPPVVSPQSFSISENRPMGYVVGTVVASDPDVGQVLTYGIASGNTNDVFALDPVTGQLTVAKATIDFETLNYYQLLVQVSDNGDPVATRSALMTIVINDLNEAPNFLPPTAFTVAENRPVGHVVGTVTATDPEMNSVTYSLVGGDPKGQFAIHAATGQLTVAKATVDFETTSQYVLQVKAQDNGNPANSRTANITVNITDLNEAPTILWPTTFAISENRPVGYVVGTVRTIDPEGNAVSYSLAGGDPNGQFAINSVSGQLTVAKATIDFETKSQYALQVKAQDNGNPANSRTANITVNIANLNEAPTFLLPTTFTIPENRPNGTVVGTVRTIDPEGHAVTYSIMAGNTGAPFAIHSTTGQLTVFRSSSLNFEVTPQFLLSVKAQDNGSPANSRTQTIIINLTDVVGARVPAATQRLGRSSSADEATFLGEQTSFPAATSAPVSARKATPYDFQMVERPAMLALLNAPADVAATGRGYDDAAGS
jgi:hypothetical protein